MPKTEAQKAANIRWAKAHPDYQREYRNRPEAKARLKERLSTEKGRINSLKAYRKCHYKMTVDDFAHFDSHDACEACGIAVAGTVKCVDHDHNTGRYRGVLCSKCNSAEGMLEGDPDRIQGLLLYVLRHK